MRFPPFIRISLLLCSLGLLRLLQPGPVPSFEELTPADVVALLVVENVSEDLELLKLGFLEDLFEEDLRSLIEQASSGWSGQVDVLRESAESLAVIVHRFESRPERSYKVHLSVLIRPRPGGVKKLDGALLGLAESLLGSVTVEETSRRERLLLGTGPGQRMYQFEVQGHSALSNSEEGSLALKEGASRKIGSLAAEPGFGQIRSRLGRGGGGIFLYCNPRPLLPVMVPFGWKVWREGGEVREELYVEGAEADAFRRD